MHESEFMFELPTLTSAMFTKPGYIHVGKNKKLYVPRWKLELWTETIEFYCIHNKMDLFYEEVPHEVWEITWEPH